MSGDNSEGVPPVPIPNTEVKPLSADGTAAWWESRSLPGFFIFKGERLTYSPTKKKTAGKVLSEAKNLYIRPKGG